MNMNSVDLYLVIHSHREGLTNYLLTVEEGGKKPTVREVIKLLDINYEPHRDENVEIEQILEDEVYNLQNLRQTNQ